MSPFDPGYYTEAELKGFGFRAVGTNVRVAKNCTIVGIANVAFGSNVRIDGNVVITAPSEPVEIGSHVHIGGGSFLLGAGGISIGDYCTTSQGVKLYSTSDDYSGAFMTNPTVPTPLTDVTTARVVLEQHVIIGSTSVVLPGCVLGEGASVGALSLVKDSLAPWGIYAGVPARLIKPRSRELLRLVGRL